MKNSRALCPYRGLVPYSEEDASFFFGREAETEIISANLMASRLTLLYGASGVGKSSVLRAGVLYHLREMAHQNLLERGSPEFSVVTFSEWRDDPIAGLINAINNAVAKTEADESLETMTASLNLAKIIEARSRTVGGEIIVILDQFEEYFLYHLQEDGMGTFDYEFPRIINRTDLPISFLISIREDALAKLDRFKGRIPNLFDNYLRIEHLDWEAARAAIKKPIERLNQAVPGAESKMNIEPELIESILNQVQTGLVVLGESGGIGSTIARRHIETPYLQLVMTRLWNAEMRDGSSVLRLATLQRLGGAERIVRTHLDDVMSKLTHAEREVSARIFNYLVTPSGEVIAHTVPDLAAYAYLPANKIARVLETLSNSEVRLLRPVAPPPEQPAVLRYAVFSNVLAPAILDWRRRYAQGIRRTREMRLVILLGLFVIVLLIIVLVQAFLLIQK